MNHPYKGINDCFPYLHGWFRLLYGWMIFHEKNHPFFNHWPWQQDGQRPPYGDCVNFHDPQKMAYHLHSNQYDPILHHRFIIILAYIRTSVLLELDTPIFVGFNQHCLPLKKKKTRNSTRHCSNLSRNSCGYIQVCSGSISQTFCYLKIVSGLIPNY